MKNFVATMVALGLMVCIGCGQDTKKKPGAVKVSPPTKAAADKAPADKADKAPADKADKAPADAKPVDAKPADVKPADAKPADAKPADAKPADKSETPPLPPAPAKK